MSDPIWIIMPILGAEQYTDQAIADCLEQSIPTRLLLINQGVASAFRTRLERIVEQYEDRVFLWSHVPPLPSLAATWNRGLQFVWETGGTEALVVNNDVRLHPSTVEYLQFSQQEEDALFITAVGVTPEQFIALPVGDTKRLIEFLGQKTLKGGPDFSCFLISKDGHDRYPFDEAFTPAFCEDLDTHRRYMLGGDGERIFSVNLPYLHYASQTLKTMSPEQRAPIDRAIERGSRAYYRSKWGGDVNQERWTIPFDPETDQDGVTTPELQQRVLSADA